MSGINGNVEQDDEVLENDNQQEDINNQQQSNEQASTGSEQWDKLIDDAAGLKQQKAQDDGGQTKAGKGAGDSQQQQDGGDKSKQNANKQQDQSNQQQRQGDVENKGVQQTPHVARKYGTLFAAGTDGHIYDAQGALVARNGSQRMVFHRLLPTIQAQERELAGLRTTVKNYTDANEIAKREGLTLDEHGAAMQMFASYKRDPVKTLNTLLTLAEQAGKDVTAIRQATGPSIADIRAQVREEIMEAVKPFSFLTEQQQQNAELNEAREAVATEYAAFIEEHPDAQIHEMPIARVMRDYNVSHREAYYAVRAWVAERGLDWSKPLDTQLQGKGQQQQRRPSGDGQNRDQMLPKMNGSRSRSEAHVEEGVNDQANANDSWDAIARRAMRANGIPI